MWGRQNTEQTDEKKENIIHWPRLPCQLYSVLYWMDETRLNNDNHNENENSIGELAWGNVLAEGQWGLFKETQNAPIGTEHSFKEIKAGIIIFFDHL